MLGYSAVYSIIKNINSKKTKNHFVAKLKIKNQGYEKYSDC